MTEASRGFVYLVGAGPGDPELLTFKAARCIAAADAILVDALVDTRVLEHAKPTARVIHVGKRGGCRSTPQQLTERLMIGLARTGAVVTRLKGGDPFVFGRGGEEALALKRAGVFHEVVPGVSSGLAAAASAGIPVTHRGVASAVTFVSGHAADGAPQDWNALVKCGGTLVIFMGVKLLPSIVDGLLQAGLPADMPAAAVERATWPNQRVVRASVAAIAHEARRAELESPAILLVGRTVALAGAIAQAGALAQAA
jgi:uroporphyrin-III C-methyltransferase